MTFTLHGRFKMQILVVLCLLALCFVRSHFQSRVFCKVMLNKNFQMSLVANCHVSWWTSIFFNTQQFSSFANMKNKGCKSNEEEFKVFCNNTDSTMQSFHLLLKCTYRRLASKKKNLLLKKWTVMLMNSSKKWDIMVLIWWRFLKTAFC